METEKRGRGRPRDSGVYTVETTVRLSVKQAQVVRRLADEKGVSDAEIIRRAIDKAAREGL